MNEASTVPAKRSGRSKLDSQLDSELERRATAAEIISTAAARRDAAIKAAVAAATDEYEAEVGTAPADLEEATANLAAFMERNHYSLVRRLSRTIKRTFGTVYVVLREKELDLPADTQALSWFLFNDEEGERLLKPYVPEVDKNVIKAAYKKGEISPRLATKLRGLGVRFGHHLTFLVKSPTDDKAVTISRRLYRPRKKAE